MNKPDARRQRMRPRYKVRYRPPDSDYEYCKYFNDLMTAQQFRLESNGTLYELHPYTHNGMIYYQWKGL